MKEDASTADLELPALLIDQIIGQERAVDVVRLAARQRRFVLFIGEPGTGKSLLGRAIAELLPPTAAHCVASVANPENPICPRIVCRPRAELEAGQRRLVQKKRQEHFSHNYLLGLTALGIILVCGWLTARDKAYGLGLAGGLALIWLWRLKKGPAARHRTLKILVERGDLHAPFIDATACSEGALFGDVRHDPYQSGGVESPPHELVEPGAVHRAHGGVLYIDEIGSLSADAQKLLLTAIQDKALPITGRQSGSSGTLIQSEPVPCDFVLVAAGNVEDLAQITPALRSRILGYGFEVLTASTMSDTLQHRHDLERFVAQEVKKDGRIPHFTAEAVEAIIHEARLRAGGKDRLTTRLRELGGLVRTAGDLAAQQGETIVKAAHVNTALHYAASIEEQRAIGQASDSLNELKPKFLAPRSRIFSDPARPTDLLHQSVDPPDMGRRWPRQDAPPLHHG
ncbi:MAG TPA: ATP-binding protein [Oligoflexus sp.]|uniref:ATP-binding protein n=1 Tax=Oligoflexus sp. TaxID=1971216 RepID=UPI002D49C8FF|nr:ATP-binding protein [Oligoflexus sp.]HYX39064.1 ATP-binding protein [Oligoflexus sp.]